jgi:phytoene dehydrogenase-like protein
MTGKWDAIVIGSGIGGLACGAALAKTGHKVLLLEQHHAAGGLTQTFSRDGYSWNIGVHYIGEMGPGDGPRAVLDWLSDGRIEMAPLGETYDTLRFPDDFEVRFRRPEAAVFRAPAARSTHSSSRSPRPNRQAWQCSRSARCPGSYHACTRPGIARR